MPKVTEESAVRPRWHSACPVGAAASRTAGTPKLGAVEPAEPGLVRSRRMLCEPRVLWALKSNVLKPISRN